MAGTNAKVYLSVIPDKNYFLAEANGYPALDYQALTDALRKQTEFAAYIDLFGTLTADDYYRTDSHWRQENLLTAADTLAAAMGAHAAGRAACCRMDTGPAKAILRRCIAATPRPAHGAGPADLPHQRLRRTRLHGVQLTELVRPGLAYDLAKVPARTPYRAVPLRVRVAAVHRKSQCGYRPGTGDLPGLASGSSLAPLLVPGYAKVTLADIRYLPSSQMGKYLTFTDQDVLFLYSAPVLNNSETLK
ncbi:MAG: hypothetical protein ACLU38_06530 [Dysosmobacter sp.]